MKIQFGNIAKIIYTGKLEDGTVFDQSTQAEPLEVVIGGGDVIQGLEDALLDMEVGEKKTLIIQPDKAYGPHDPSQIAVVEKSLFPANFPFKLGQRLTIPHESGSTMEATVETLTDTQVTLDGNHPYARKVVVFDIEVIEIT